MCLLNTQVLLDVNYFLTHYWGLTFLSAGVLAFVFTMGIRTTKGRRLWDTFKLKVWIFGPLFRRIYMARFTYLVATMIRSGLPVLDTFRLAQDTMTNVTLVETVGNIAEGVRAGRTIASVMAEQTAFPELVVQMVRIGEESGKIDDLLEQVASFYEEEADNIIGNLTTLIEPIILVFMGCIVLVMALGIFLPLWNLQSAMSGGQY